MTARITLACLCLLAACGEDAPVGPSQAVPADATGETVAYLADADAGDVSDSANVAVDAVVDVQVDKCLGVVCDDSNACTQDSCTGGQCFHIAILGPCEDGNACTLGDACVDGVCLPGSVTDCVDGNVCTDDSCDLASGCTHTANATACDDGSACTQGDACAGGVCAGDGLAGISLYHGVTPTGNVLADPGASAVVRTAAGGYAFVGHTMNHRMWLVVTDANGKRLWDKTYGKNTYGNGMAVMADGGYVLVGWTYDGTPGNRDFFTVRTNASGDALWSKVWGGAADDNPQAVATTADGGVIVIGVSSSNPGPSPPAYFHQPMAVRYAADGSELWSKTYGVPGYQEATSIAHTADGGFAILGNSYLNVNTPQFDSEAWLIQIDADGALQWQMSYGDAGQPVANGVAGVPDNLGGGFVLAGRRQPNPPGDAECWLVRVDASGKELWAKTFGGPQNDECLAVAVLADGSFALTGYYAGGTSPKFWLFRVDTQGTLLWEDVLPSSTGGWGYGLCADALTGMIAAVGFRYVASVEWTTYLSEAVLLRTDAFGNTSCATSGVCLPFALTTCDDANPCTADLCDAAHSGCWHTNLPDDTTCGTAKACEAGVCKSPTPDGMVLIPAGTFWMGCNSAKDSHCYGDESPQHKVTLSAYYMDVTETTVGQYKACVDAGVCTAPSYVQPDSYATYPGLTNNPVNYVNWTQSQQYCKWRGSAFDLPTEAQWEMAARGSCEKNGSTASDPACAQAMRTYPWGEGAATCGSAVMSNGTYGCGTSATWAVGSIAAGDSPYGLHDMAGNVWEWNRDWYGSYSSGAVTDPAGPGSASNRLYRGGGFDDDAVALRAGFRYDHYPSYASFLIGLRCMKSYP